MLIQAVPAISLTSVSFCALTTTAVSTLRVSVTGSSIQSYSATLAAGSLFLSLDFSWEGPPPYTVMVGPPNGSLALASATVLETSALVTYVPISGAAILPPFLVVRTQAPK